MWLVSYRGERKTAVDNIGVFEDDGRPRKQHPLLLDPAKDACALRIPRGFTLVGDDLYIASAWHRDSHIARYRRQGDTFRFAEVVMTTAELPAMVHPFDVQLGDDGRVYISSQDTNTVVALVPGTHRPAPVVAALRRSFPGGHFLPGTLVASSRGGLPAVGGAAPVDVPSPLGLELVLDKRGEPKHSVRGIVVHRGHLYVADEAGDEVKVFDLGSGSLVDTQWSARGAGVRLRPRPTAFLRSPAGAGTNLSGRRSVMNRRSKALRPVLTAMGAGVLLLSGAAFGAPSVDDSVVNTASGQTRSQLIRTSATIAGIDNTDRSVMIKTNDGTENWVHVPESVAGFDRLKMGDKVNVGYYQSLAVSLAPSGSKPSMSATKAGAVDLGAGIQGREFKLSAKVVSVDQSANTVTFKGPKGRVRTVNVEDPALQSKLATLKPGQVVQLDYTEAVAADIRPASD